VQKRKHPSRQLQRVRKPRRADIFPSKLNELDVNAPEGRYLVDSLTSKLQACRWLVSVPERRDNKLLQPYQIIRDVVNFAGRMAVMLAINERELPQHKAIAKSYFASLFDIRKSISDVCKIDPNDIAGVVHKLDLTEEDEPGREFEDAVDKTISLLESLMHNDRLIERYLKTFVILKSRGGNVDWLGSYFIQFVAGMGLRRMKGGTLPALQSTDVKLFSALLDAAWTDLKFPLEDHRGKALEPLDLYFEVRLKSMLKANRLQNKTEF
jgi:hypothetical protein